ncbi:MAG: twitching motility protein PilT [Methanobrevibacter sp.]|jgi:rRNA-processing protein FCF1|nr:twitching motility protein PilT [Candidatus Methanoflexus mossambicus]
MKSKKEIIIDTNFFFIPFHFNIDIIDEFKKTFPGYKLVTTNFIIDELVGLKKNSKGKDRINSSLALKLAKSDKINLINIDLKENEQVDDALIRISNIIATNDKELRIKARKREIAIIYLRQKKFLELDGYLH